MRTLHEAERVSGAARAEITQLAHYAEGMQAFLEGDYRQSFASLEAWVEAGGPGAARDRARRAASALSRVERLVGDERDAPALVDAAKQLQLRLEAATA